MERPFECMGSRDAETQVCTGRGGQNKTRCSSEISDGIVCVCETKQIAIQRLFATKSKSQLFRSDL